MSSYINSINVNMLTILNHSWGIKINNLIINVNIDIGKLNRTWYNNIITVMPIFFIIICFSKIYHLQWNYLIYGFNIIIRLIKNICFTTIK